VPKLHTKDSKIVHGNLSFLTSSQILYLQLHQQSEDRNVLRYVYYYLARILSDNGSQGLSAAGGIPTPNWDALADIDAVGGVTRADVVPRIVDQLSAESSSDDVERMCLSYPILHQSCYVQVNVLILPFCHLHST
jgi:hypothetical protein